MSMQLLRKGLAELNVATGDSFALELPETPTTGFRWHLDTRLELVSSEFVSSAAGQPGAGGVRRFVLKAASPGRYPLGAVLRRGWLGDSSRVDEFAATVVAS
jgi:inhibitor of cysteine peptidase